MQKKTQKKMNNELLKSLVVVLLNLYYFKLSRDEFENKVKTTNIVGEKLSRLEYDIVIEHFRKQIYPVPNDVLKWMRKNIKKEYEEIDGINFYDRHKELQQLYAKNV